MTILDPHWGTISDWRDAIDAIHAHNMYLMVDFTVGTMSDIIGFEGYVETSFRTVVILNPSLPVT